MTSIVQVEDISQKICKKEDLKHQYIEIKRKDHTTVTFEKQGKKISIEKLNQKIFFEKVENFFVFEFQKHLDIHLRNDSIFDLSKEFKRQDIEFDKNFEIKNQNFCSSYPSKIVVPKDCKDEILIGSSEFRSQQRIPIITWINNKTKIPLIRSSQPKTGLMGKSEEDQELIQLYSKSKDFFIIDCRPWKNAVGNKLIVR